MEEELLSDEIREEIRNYLVSNDLLKNPNCWKTIFESEFISKGGFRDIRNQIMRYIQKERIIYLHNKIKKYVFENIFEIFSDEDIDLSKIKKIFLLTRKILKNEKKGKKIFEDLLISNHNQFIEYYCKNEFILSEDNESNFSFNI